MLCFYECYGCLTVFSSCSGLHQFLSCLAHLRFSTWPKSIIIPADLQMPLQKHFNSQSPDLFLSHTQWTTISLLWDEVWERSRWEQKGEEEQRSVRQEQKRINYFSVWPGETRIRLSLRQSDGTHSLTLLV